MFVLGIDIAKRTLAVALLRPDEKWRSKTVVNTSDGHRDLLAWVGRHAPDGPVQVCLVHHAVYKEWNAFLGQFNVVRLG